MNEEKLSPVIWALMIVCVALVLVFAGYWYWLEHKPVGNDILPLTEEERKAEEYRLERAAYWEQQRAWCAANPGKCKG